MKKIVICLSFIAAIASAVVCLSNKKSSSSPAFLTEQNIEALADDEINIELLKEMFQQEIWMYKIGAWQPGETLVNCRTGGYVQCPLG